MEKLIKSRHLFDSVVGKRKNGEKTVKSNFSLFSIPRV